jgi:peptide/nickel transport system permease protein
MATISSNETFTPPETIELTPELARKRRSQGRIIFDRFIRNKVAVAGCLVLMILGLAAIFAPLLTAYNPDVYNIQLLTAPPSPQHLLGTDDLGRDELTRLLYGARVSLLVGIASTAVLLMIGVIVGATAGFFGGWVDAVLMRITDAFLSIPYLVILFTFGAIFSDGSIKFIVILIAIFSWAIAARIVRSSFIEIKEREFLLAARTLGAGNLRLMFLHILPNAIGPIIVVATLSVAGNIITESVLSYFGFGLQPPTSSWGTMLTGSQAYVTSSPLLLWAPGLAILITALCINLMGDGLRDALDPYMTER